MREKAHSNLPGFSCDCGEPLENFEIENGYSRCPNCGETYGK